MRIIFAFHWVWCADLVRLKAEKCAKRAVCHTLMRNGSFCLASPAVCYFRGPGSSAGGQHVFRLLCERLKAHVNNYSRDARPTEVQKAQRSPVEGDAPRERRGKTLKTKINRNVIILICNMVVAGVAMRTRVRPPR